mgnify:CR=1 FL=1
MLDYLMKTDESAVESGASTKSEQQAEEKTEQEDAEPVTKAASDDPVSAGQSLASQNGCLGCHSIDGSRRVGPSFKGFLGSERTVIKDGQTVKVQADSAYLIRALRQPGEEVTEGYPPAMPPYPGLTDDDIKAIESWLETLK